MTANMGSLDLVGVISLLSGSVAVGSLKLANANRLRLFTSLLVVPGLYGVCAKVLRRNGNFLARTLSPEDREDVKAIVGTNSSRSYRYVGVKSGTDAVIKNALFESWITAHNNTKQVMDVKCKRDGGTPTVVGFTTCTKYKPGTKIIVQETMRMLISLVFQAGAIAVLVFTFMRGELVGIILQILNMVTYFLIVAVVSFTHFTIPKPTSSDGVPPGNMMITDNDSENMWAIRSLDENATQSMTVCEVSANRSGAERTAETILCTVGSAVSIATVLLVPIMSYTAKVYFIIQYAIGLFSCVIFSSRDIDATLSKDFTWYTMKETTMVRFSNRAAAAAAAMLHTEADPSCIKDSIIPSNSSWAYYRSALEQLKDEGFKKKIKTAVGTTPTVKNVADKLSDETNLKNVNGDDYGKFPRRLVADIAEAFIFIEKVNVTSYDEHTV